MNNKPDMTKPFGGAAKHSGEAPNERMVMCRNYQTSVGNGFALLQLTLPERLNKEDVNDLRAWLALIDRQIARLETKNKGARYCDEHGGCGFKRDCIACTEECAAQDT